MCVLLPWVALRSCYPISRVWSRLKYRAYSRFFGNFDRICKLLSHSWVYLGFIGKIKTQNDTKRRYSMSKIQFFADRKSFAGACTRAHATFTTRPGRYKARCPGQARASILRHRMLTMERLICRWTAQFPLHFADFQAQVPLRFADFQARVPLYFAVFYTFFIDNKNVIK